MKSILFLAIAFCIAIQANSQPFWHSNSAGIYYTSGNVGIGSSSPWERLTIEPGNLTLSNNKSTTYTEIGSLNFANRAISGAVSSSNLARIRAETSGSYYAGNLIFEIRSGGATYEAMKIKHNGYLGIGTSDPVTRLNIGGSETTNRISQSGGTYTELAQRTWGGSAGIIFSAYTPTNYVNGGISATGNTKYKYNANVFGSSEHGAKMISVDHSSIGFFISPASTGINNSVVWGDPVLYLKRGGNVGIGTTDPLSKLSVDGQIRSTEVKVMATITVPDYVFDPDYKLATLKETKIYINKNRHLPEIPSAAEIGENGIDLGDMNMRLLKKIEELTLHLIRIDEELQIVREQNQKILKHNQQLKSRNSGIKGN